MLVKIKIPDGAFNGPEHEVPRRVLEAVAIEGFKSDQLSTAQVRRLLGFETRFEVHKFLGQHGIPWVRYSVEDAERERIVLRELLSR